MTLGLLQALSREIQLQAFRLRHLCDVRFECPVCGYIGPFRAIDPETGLRKHAQCPQCDSLERHRLQYLTVQYILEDLNVSEMRMLHFAPEESLRRLFSIKFGKYETADISMDGVDHKVDIQSLPFSDSTYDFIFASHVLEHIPDDRKAIKEIRRILRPNGIAVLPVPVVSIQTVEYLEPNPYEANHVRAPGLDYFDRYEPFFSEVSKFRSDSFPEKFQLFIYEDRSGWPTDHCPMRSPMWGERHLDIVPVCYA